MRHAIAVGDNGEFDGAARARVAVVRRRDAEWGGNMELVAAANAALKASKPCFDNIEAFIEAARDHVGEEEAAPREWSLA